jgi:hypothetical protein
MPLFPYEELTLDSPLPLSEVSQRLMSHGDPSVTGTYSLHFSNQVLDGKITDQGFDLIPQLGYRSKASNPAIHGDWTTEDGKTQIRLKIKAQDSGIYWTKFFVVLSCLMLLVSVFLEVRDYLQYGRNNAYPFLTFPWILGAMLSYVQLWGRFKEEGRKAKTNLASLWEIPFHG